MTVTAEGFDSICKYGTVPKDVMPEIFNSSNSSSFVEQINFRLRRTAMKMRKAHAGGERN